MTKLTESDRETITHLPDGWFEAMDLPWFLKRPVYRCQRLKKAGVLETRVVGMVPSLTTQYRRIESS